VSVDGGLTVFRLEFPDTHNVTESDSYITFAQRSAGAVGNLGIHDE
jgi:hypothetical protein